MLIPGVSKKRESSKQADLLFLDALRGLAAGYVVMSHLLWMLWDGWENRARLDILPRLSSDFFRYEHEAVIFFFVLSGFVIHLRYALQMQGTGCAKPWSVPDYFKRRAQRIYPPFILALVLTYGFDQFGVTLGFPNYFSQTPYPWINNLGLPSYGAPVFFGNILFLMTAGVPVWGTNGALWSLMYEGWFYILYPLFWFVIQRSFFFFMALLAVPAFLSMGSAQPLSFLPNLLAYMLIWSLGGLLAEIYAGRLKVRFGVVALFLLLFPIGLTRITPQHHTDFLWGLIFMGLLALCLHFRERLKNSFLVRLHGLGDFSYTLYLIQSPLIIFLSGFLMSRNSEHLLPRHFGGVLLGLGVVYPAAYLMHLVTEKPFTGK